MNYIIAPIKKAVGEYKFPTAAHKTREEEIILNEREVMNNINLSGKSLDDRVAELDGTLISEQQAIYKIKTESWV
jgi:hypothetical protein